MFHTYSKTSQRIFCHEFSRNCIIKHDLNFRIVELLLNQDNCVITKVSDYQRLITIAASKNNDEIIEMVMSKCSSLGMIDKASAITSSIDGAKRLLLEAAQSGDLEFLRRLVNLHHADTTHGDLEGITVLSWAIISSHR